MKTLDELMANKIIDLLHYILSKFIKPDITLEKVNELDSNTIDKLKQQYGIEGIILDVAVAGPRDELPAYRIVLGNGELRALQRHAGVAVLLAQHELCGGGRCIRLDLVGDAAVAGFAAVAQGHGVAHLVAGGSTAILHIAVIHKDQGRHIGDLHMEPAVLVRFQDAVHVARHLFVRYIHQKYLQPA